MYVILDMFVQMFLDLENCKGNTIFPTLVSNFSLIYLHLIFTEVSILS